MTSIRALTSNLPSSSSVLDFSTLTIQKIQYIDSLNRFTNLQVLNVSNQKIIKIQNLPSSITILNIQFNQIRVLQNIQHLIFLQELYLSHNIIKLVHTLENNKKLKILELAHNDLDITSLKDIATCEGLNILTLEGNPLVQQISYKTVIVLIMKDLILLDKQSVKKQFSLSASFGCVKQSIEDQQICQKQTIPKDGKKPKYHKKQKVVQNKIQKLRKQNLSIIQQIIEQQGKAQEIGQHFYRHTHRMQQRQVLEFIEQKYNQSLNLEQKLKQLQRIVSPTIQQQKQRNHLLQKLIGNQQTLERYQKQLQNIRTSNDLQTINKSQSQNSNQIYSQLNQIHNKVEKLRKRLKSNEQLIQKYSLSFRNNDFDKSQDGLVQVLIQLVFGQYKSIDFHSLKNLSQRYPQGLLNILEDLADILFGTQPSLQKIQLLKQSLKGKALIDWFCQKNRSKQRIKNFLHQKQNFIHQFSKQTQDLLSHWTQLKKAQAQFQSKKDQYKFHKISYQQQFSQEIKRIQIEHQQKLQKQLDVHFQKLKSIQQQISSLLSNKKQLQNDIVCLSQQKMSIQNTKFQLEKMKQQVRKKKLQLNDLKSQMENNIQQNFRIESNIKLLAQKYNIKHSQLLDIDAQCKLMKSKVSFIDSELLEAKNQIQQHRNQLNNLKSLVHQQQKKLQRARTGVLSVQDKLDNLTKLSNSKKVLLDNLQRELVKLTDLKKKRSAQSIGSEEQLLIQDYHSKNKI